MDISLTRLSSKGQIVIPAELREGLASGDQFAIIKQDNTFLLKPLKDMQEQFEEDLAFAKRTEKRLAQYEAGEFETMDADEFIAAAKQW